MTNFGGYKIFHPRLTTYCQGCVLGVPGGVDAPVHLFVHFLNNFQYFCISTVFVIIGIG